MNLNKQNEGKAMATLMQKDVLIEMVASASAAIYHYHEKNGESAASLEDQLIVRNKRTWVYGTSCKDVEYQKELKTLQEIEKKYKLN